MTIKPSFAYELEMAGPVIGIDEAGCGAWAGPVIAGAAWIDQDLAPKDILDKINDSKQLSKDKRTYLFEIFQAASWIEVGIGQADVAEIDSLNIGRATLLAMERAVLDLTTRKIPQGALIDGIRKPSLPCPVVLIKKGDQLSLSIASASIAAKVTRDKIMEQLSEEFPHYGWNHNVGYGTKHHQQSLETYGISEHHRKSYAPIAKFIRLSNTLAHPSKDPSVACY